MFNWVARLVLAGFLSLQASFAQTLAEKIEALAAGSPVASRGHWGAYFIHLGSGEIVFARNENHFFVPASNTKLFSTALALSRLGPDHRQVTRLIASSAVAANGVLAGDLRMVGAGDATMSGRPLPYDVKAKFGDPLAALDELAEQAWKNGLRRVDGDVIGDDSAYVWEPFPDGWSFDDTKYSYGAPVSALMLHDNTFTIRVQGGGHAGEPARVSVAPSPGYWTLESRIRTAAPSTGLKLEREPGSRQVELWGTVAPNRARELSLAVDDPAAYAAFALREALGRRGIAVTGRTGVRHRHPLMIAAPPGSVGSGATVANLASEGEIELARRTSPPIVETLRVIDKVSHNLAAEAVMLEVARVRGRVPDRSGAVEELKLFLEEAGIPAEDYQFEDGSGLSRLTLVTPAAVMRLLRFMHGSSYKDVFRNLLPQGGLDGTLDDRFRRLKGVTIFAKTGSLSHTAALSGYIERPDADPIAFSVIVNNAKARGAAMRDFIDKLVAAVIQHANTQSDAR